MKKAGLVLIGLVMALTLAACEVLPKSVLLEGPATAKVSGVEYKATALGVYPGVGTASFLWWADVNNDVKIQEGELLKRITLVGDAEQKAVSTLKWKPKSSLVGKKFPLIVGVTFQDPGTEETVTEVDSMTITVKR